MVNRKEAKRILALVVDEKVPISYSKHARQRMIERGVTHDDFLHVIGHPATWEEQECELQGGQKYRVGGYDLDGRWLEVVVLVDECPDRAILITAF